MQKIKDLIKTNKTTQIIIGIVLFLAVIFIIYKIFIYLSEYVSPVLVNGIKSAKNELVIPSNQLPSSKNGIEYTYSFWMFIDDWNYKYGESKNILFRGSNGTRNLSVSLYPKNNNLMVRVDDNSTSGKYIKEKTTITLIPCKFFI